MTKSLKFWISRALSARFLSSSSGAVKVEYALLVFLIGVTLLGVLEAIGLSITDILNTANEGIESGTEE